MNVPSRTISDSASNFKTSRVVTTGSDALKIVPTFRAVAIGLFLFMFLNGIFSYMVYGGVLILLDTDNYLIGLLLLVGGLAFIWGSSKFKLLAQEIIKLDRNSGSYRRYSIWKPNNFIESKELSDFSEVQILKKLVKTHNTQRSVEFTSYEINLCSADSSRINLIDHSIEKEIISDASIISRFINVPVVRSNA